MKKNSRSSSRSSRSGSRSGHRPSLQSAMFHHEEGLARTGSVVTDFPEEGAFKKVKKDRDAEVRETTEFLLDLRDMKDSKWDHSRVAKILGLDDHNKQWEKVGNTRMEQCRSYVPDYVIRYFNNNLKEIEHEQQMFLHCCVMFADVSGFTKLTERLSQNISQESPSKKKDKSHDEDKQTVERGAEELVEHLNRYFKRIIQIIQGYGGDIIKFAGDAMLCIFDIQEEPDDNSEIEVDADGLSEEQRKEAVKAAKEERRKRQEQKKAERPEKIKQQIMKALWCAEELHKIEEAARTVGDVKLKLHVGIGAGELRFVFVGGLRGRWEFLVTDTVKRGPIFQMGIAEGNAAPDETCVHRSVYEMVPDRILKSVAIKNENKSAVIAYRIDKVEPPANNQKHKPTDIVLPDDKVYLIENFVPGAVKYRLGAVGGRKWMCDLRRVSILFINLTGLDPSSQNYLAKLQHCMEIIQSCLYAEEGSVNKFLADDKGTTLIAGFGLPPLSHRDDPLRAVRAAIRISQRLVDDKEKEQEGGRNEVSPFASIESAVLPSIGITTGNCFCGIVGGGRREYTMMGDIVNLAARLMQYSNGDVVVDSNTYKESVHEIDYAIRPDIKVKGKKDPIKVFSPDPDSNVMVSRHLVDSQLRTAFVGRDDIVEQFQELIDAHVAGFDSHAMCWDKKPEGQLVHLTGEVGIGKSRLVDKLINLGGETMAGREGVGKLLVVLGEAKEHDKYCYNAWVPIILNLLALLRDIQEMHKEESERLDSVNEEDGEGDAQKPQGAEEGAAKSSGSRVDLVKSSSRRAPKLGIHRTASEQWQQYHQNRMAERQQSMADKGEVKEPKVLERAELVRQESARYQRVRGSMKPRVKRDFKDLAQELPLLLSSSDFSVDDHELLLEVLQLSLKNATERGPVGIVGSHELKTGKAPVEAEAESRAAARKSLANIVRFLIETVNDVYPLMVVLDDANFLDEESWELTALLCQKPPPILFVVAENMQRRDPWRVKELKPFYTHVDHPSCSNLTLEVGKMNDKEMVMLIKDHLNAQSVPMVVLDMLVMRSEGVPLFCERLMARLLMRKIIKVHRHDLSGRSLVILKRKDQLQHVRIDADLMTMLRAVLDKLSASEQRILKLAAVVASCNRIPSNPIFTVHLLTFMDQTYQKHQGDEELRELLGDLCHKRLVEKVDDELAGGRRQSRGDGFTHAYRFRSTLFCEVVYRSIPFRERQMLHRILARSVEIQMENAGLGKEPATVVLLEKHWRKWNELIADHYTLSGNNEEAFQRCVQLGEFCLSHGMDSLAAEVLEKCLLCYARIDMVEAARKAEEAGGTVRYLRHLAVKAMYQRGLALFRLGQTDEAAEMLEDGLLHAGFAIPQSRLHMYQSTMSQRLAKALHKKALASTAPDQPVKPKHIKDSKRQKTTFLEMNNGEGEGASQEFCLSPGGSRKQSLKWENKRLTDEESNRVIAKIYTWLAVVYYETNHKMHGDWASTHAIYRFRRSNRDTDMGLVSLAYAHGCVNSQVMGSARRAAMHHRKARFFMGKLTDQPAHKHAKLDVMTSVTEYAAGYGRWDEVVPELMRAVAQSEEIGDRRVWTKCVAQMGFIALYTGRLFDAVQLFLAVFQSITLQAEDERAGGVETQVILGVSSALLALGDAALAEEAVKASLNTELGGAITQAWVLWQNGRIEESLLDVYRTLNTPPEVLNSMWVQYWHLVAVLDTLTMQWARLLAAAYDRDEAFKGAGGAAAKQDDEEEGDEEENKAGAEAEKVGGSVSIAPGAGKHNSLLTALSPRRFKPGVFGMAEREEAERRRQSAYPRNLSTAGRPSKVFVDDLEQIVDKERILERIPYVRKPAKRTLKDLEAFARVFPFATTTVRVYACLQDILTGTDPRRAVAKMWRSLFAVVSGTPTCPRDHTLAVLVAVVATDLWGNEQPLGEKRCSVAYAAVLDKLREEGLLGDLLLRRMIDAGLNGITGLPKECTNELSFGKALHTLHTHVSSELRRGRSRVRACSYTDLDEWAGGMAGSLQTNISETPREDRVKKIGALLDSPLWDNGVDEQLERVTRLVLKAHEYKSWKLDQQHNDDLEYDF